MDRLLNDTAEVYRRGQGSDRYGNAAGAWQLVTVIRVRLEEQVGEEETQDAESIRERGRMWTRYADLQNEDQVIVGAKTWDVDGQPILRQDAGSAHHYEARLKRASL